MWPRKLPRLKFLLTSVFFFTFPFSPSQYITVRNGLWPTRVNFKVIKPENQIIKINRVNSYAIFLKPGSSWIRPSLRWTIGEGCGSLVKVKRAFAKYFQFWSLDYLWIGKWGQPNKVVDFYTLTIHMAPGLDEVQLYQESLFLNMWMVRRLD
jgi:hypothetical protein